MMLLGRDVGLSRVWVGLSEVRSCYVRIGIRIGRKIITVVLVVVGVGVDVNEFMSYGAKRGL